MIHPPAEREIEGRNFRVAKLQVMKQVELKARILRVLGPAAKSLPEILAGRAKEDATPEDRARADGAAIEAMMGVFTGNDSQAITSLISDVVRLAEIQGDSGTFTRVSIERDIDPLENSLLALYTLFYFVLSEQFASFFSGLMASMSRAGWVRKIEPVSTQTNSPE